MLRLKYTIVLFFVFSLFSYAQIDKKEVRRGNRHFKKEKYKDADIDYRRALLKDSLSFVANYNLANTLYRQDAFAEGLQFMSKLADFADNSAYASDFYYNFGNLNTKQKKYQEALNAYKQSLLKNPDDIDAKENYLYVKKLLEQQKKKQQQNKDKKDKQNKDKKDKNKDKKDQNKDKKDKQNPKNNKSDKKQQKTGAKLSPQQAQRLLKAMQAKEKEVQDKVKKAKILKAGKKKKKEKNW